MRNFIGVGNKPYWQESLQNPGAYARWVILQQGDTDAVWRGLSAQSRSILDDHFVEVYRVGAIHVYKKRPASAEFVEKRGQHLYLDGQRWNAVGVNSYDLLEQPQRVIDDRLNQLANGGLNTVRTWCFDKDGGISDATLDTLAVTLHTAYGRGLRVICTLANYYPDFGGQRHFTPQGEEFFTSDAARARYRDQVRRVLEYRDRDGLRLADNPAILAWDLINEPRTNPGTSPGSVPHWTEAMGGFVSSIDQRHLVTVGGEGFTPGYPADAALAAGPGTDFTDLCGLSPITLCSAHLFPKYLTGPPDGQNVGQVVERWRTEADRLEKPMILGEVGYSLADAGNVIERQKFYDNAARAVDSSDLDGALLWNLGARADATFTVAYGDQSSDRVLGAWSSAIPKNP
jgi:mannan endo-1,4-beta-mannosidase